MAPKNNTHPAIPASEYTAKIPANARFHFLILFTALSTLHPLSRPNLLCQTRPVVPHPLPARIPAVSYRIVGPKPVYPSFHGKGEQG